MKLVRFFLLIFCFHYTIDIFSQTPYHNLEKYWYYRKRLKEKFMVVSSGNQPGTNIPAFRRRVMVDPPFEQCLQFGDATAELGIYMAVLATEFKLLYEYGQPYDETLNELSYALLALERLDLFAEANFRQNLRIGHPEHPCGLQGCYYVDQEADLNGFFMRDDVPPTFTQNWLPTHPDFATTPNIYSSYASPYKNNNGSWEVDYNNTEAILSNEMSQDQVWNLLPALALVMKYVTISNTYYDIKGRSWRLDYWAANISARIINRFNVRIDVPVLGYRDTYQIFNPVNGNIVHTGGGYWDMALSGQLFDWANDFINQSNTCCWGNTFQAMDYPMGTTEFFIDHGQLLLRSVANHTFQNYFSPTVTNEFEAMLQHIFDCRAYTHERKNYAFEHIFMYYMLLHPNASHYSYSMVNEFETIIEDLLNQAPDCGPSNIPINDPNCFSEVWSAVSHYSNPGQAYEGIGGNAWLNGEYNGLDYMVLHNLYWLTYVHKQPVINYSNSNVVNSIVNYPTEMGLGTDAIPQKLMVKFPVYSFKNILSSGANVTYIGEDLSSQVFDNVSIQLDPGFEVKLGAKFTADPTVAYGKMNYPRFKKLNWTP